MTKLDILRLDSTTENDTAATLNINTNFENIQKAIENTLSRDGTTPNYMDADLDMNSYRIINVGEAVNDTDAVSYKQFKEEIGEATVAASQAAASAAQAATSAQSALVSSTNAINSVRNAENVLSYAQNLLSETQEYVDTAKADIAETASTNEANINKTVADAKQEINTAIDEAEMSLSDTITQATEDVKQQALDAAQGAINDAAAEATAIVINYANNEIKPLLNEIADNAAEDAANAAESAEIASTKAAAASTDAEDAEHYAKDARIWAEGTDSEVQSIDGEHSAKVWAKMSEEFSKSLNTENLVKTYGDNTIEGTLTVADDSNHPITIEGMAGTTATGFQITDSNGKGETDLEHYATGDRYGSRLLNRSTATGKEFNVDMYQTTAGKSVLDLSKADSVLVKGDKDLLTNVVDTTSNQTVGGTKTFSDSLNLVQGQNDKLFFKDTRVDVSASTGTDTFNSIIFRDKNNFNYANVAVQDEADGGKRLRLLVQNKLTDGTTKSEQIWIDVEKNGNVVTYAPTPATNSNSTNIATTSWFRNNMQVVTSIPSSPTAGVFYFVKE